MYLGLHGCIFYQMRMGGRIRFVKYNILKVQVQVQYQYTKLVPGCATVPPTGMCLICAAGELQEFVSDWEPVTCNPATQHYICKLYT